MNPSPNCVDWTRWVPRAIWMFFPYVVFDLPVHPAAGVECNVNTVREQCEYNENVIVSVQTLLDNVVFSRALNKIYALYQCNIRPQYM